MSIVYERYSDIISRICEYADRDGDIRAVIVIGSSTRKDVPSDEYSDLDLIIVTRSPEGWYSGEYPALLGNTGISFIEPTLGGGRERRCIYDKDKDVDMIIFTPEQYETALSEGVAAWVMNRGYVYLRDKENYAEITPQYVKPKVSPPSMTEEDFVNTVSDFFFHNIWAYKKLLRGELWSAKMSIDCYLKSLLLKIIEQYGLVSGVRDVWHDGRFLDSWAEPSILRELDQCFAHYDVTDCEKALKATHKLFARLARTVADKRGFSYPDTAEGCAAEYLGSRD